MLDQGRCYDGSRFHAPKPHIEVIGDAVMDRFIVPPQSAIQGDSIVFENGIKYKMEFRGKRPGGNNLNMGAAAQADGAVVEAYTWLAKYDPSTTVMRRDFKQHHVRLAHQDDRDPEHENSTSTILLGTGEPPILSEKQQREHPFDPNRMTLKDADLFIVTSTSDFWKPPFDLVTKHALRNGKPYAFCPGSPQYELEDGNLPPEFWETLRYATYFISNWKEAAKVTGKDPYNTTPEEMVTLIQEKGPREVVITRSSQGVCAKSADGTFYETPSYATEVVDATGGGDTFTGTYLTKRTKKVSIEDSLEAGQVVSAHVVRYVGGHSGIPSKKTVDVELKMIDPTMRTKINGERRIFEAAKPKSESGIEVPQQPHIAIVTAGPEPAFAQP